MPLPWGVRAVLTDIEGTTSSISFVYETLFPYAKERLVEACARAADDARISAAVARLREEHAEETHEGAEGLPGFGDGAAYAAHLMEQDRKSTGLKALQGIIWEEGYRDGRILGHVYDDVPAALRRWKDAAIRLRVFSSGSVLAQRLLFAHTTHGNLTGFFEGYHDTTTGPKRTPGSYRTIAEAFGLPPREICFLSDVVPELDAARDAGMQTVLLVRPGNPPTPSGGHPIHHDFLGLTP